jgi:crossover junction endodeoxyribonuclease RusA
VTARQWEVSHDQRPLPANAYRRQHFQVRARYDREWRNSFGWRARQERVPALKAAIVTVYQVCRRPPLPDVGACFETAKAAIDGLVDAGVLPDDDPAHLVALNFVAPTRGETDRLILVIEEYTEGAVA